MLKYRQQEISGYEDFLHIKSSIKQRNVLTVLELFISSNHLNHSRFFAVTYLGQGVQEWTK